MTGRDSAISSVGTAKVVSKGGLIHDNLRESQIRRDNYLRNLVNNRIS